jgi:hypothetical protein
MNQDTMAGGLRRVLPVSLRSPAVARVALDTLADDLPSDLLRDTKLLVSELISHRVRRKPLVDAGTLTASTLTLDVSVTEARVHVEVRYDERGSVAPRAEAGEPTLGWQLHLVAELADRWGIERDGLTTVWFELDR